MSEKVLTTSNMSQIIADAQVPVIVDFWAEWCGPCRMMAPILHSFAETYAGKVLVGKVNVDEEPALASKYGISAIPTLIVFKNGEPAGKQVGLCSLEMLEGLTGVK